MENYKNLKEDKEFFPYEYGASRYSQTSGSIMKLSIREELASKIVLIYTHMEENGVLFSSPGGSFKRKLIINLSHYMNIPDQIKEFVFQKITPDLSYVTNEFLDRTRIVLN